MSGGLLTTAEASAYLRIHRTTLLEWVRDGRLKHVRVGRNVIRFTPAQLEEFVEEHLVA